MITFSPKKREYSPRGIEKIFLQEKRNFPYGKENNPFKEEERSHSPPGRENIFPRGLQRFFLKKNDTFIEEKKIVSLGKSKKSTRENDHTFLKEEKIFSPRD